MPYEHTEPRVHSNPVSSQAVYPSLGCMSYYSMLAEQKERRRIAAHIHDNIIKDLVFCNLRLGLSLKSDSVNELAGALEETQCLVRLLIEKMRMVLAEISPPLLFDIGLDEAVRELLEETRNRCGISYYFEGDNSSLALDKEQRVLVYEAIRQLLLNIISHARAKTIWVNIHSTMAGLEVVVEDDGTGFDAPAVISSLRPADGVGLLNLRERLCYLGGCLDIQSKPENGTRVTLSVPISATP